MRDIDAIHGFQVIQAPGREITINYTSDANLSTHTTRLVRRRLSKIDGRLEAACIKRVPEIRATVAGKSKRIVSHIDEEVERAS